MSKSTRQRDRRVVVTGLSVISPLAAGLSQTWEKALNGQSGIRKSPVLEAANIDICIAGEVPDLTISDHFNKKELRKIDRFIQLILICTKEAVKDSGLEMNETLALRSGVITGSAMGGMGETIKQQAILDSRALTASAFFLYPLFSPIWPRRTSVSSWA